jgi:hypothetical protein
VHERRFNQDDLARALGRAARGLAREQVRHRGGLAGCALGGCRDRLSRALAGGGRRDAPDGVRDARARLAGVIDAAAVGLGRLAVGLVGA